MAQIKYFVDIKGHEPPFRWTLIRMHENHGHTRYELKKGKADTLEEAAFAAQEAARRAHYKLLYESVTLSLELFEGQDSVPEEDRPHLTDSFSETLRRERSKLGGIR